MYEDGRQKAIVLVSGGLDSLVAAALAKRDNEEVYFLHLNYGQRTENRELLAYEQICDHFSPDDTKIIRIDFIKEFGGNALTDFDMDIDLNLNDYDQQSAEFKVPNTYVPFRNGIFLSIATCWAEVKQATRIYIGTSEIDGSGYPDCKATFFQAIQTAIMLGVRGETNIQICAPLMKKSKSEIVKLGIELKVPFEFSWSCYKENFDPCGVCDSCYHRRKAFEEAGIEDPLACF